ncbi:MAG: glycosyltransferase family 4 protein [Syntrophaceae bacterium]|nr:glycosyltransferase family 4 protein [Syntrophaceae bacterium]
MKILHLFSNWKWTGPADPTLNLCKGLEKRGHDVTFAYRRPPFPVEDSIEKRVVQAGIKATDRFRLDHSVRFYHPSFFWINWRDISDLTQYLRQEKFDILNVHHSHGHILGGIAARRSGRPVIVIRTDHKRDSLKPGLGNSLLISQLTDGMITFSEKAKREDVKNFGIPPERVRKITPALDLSRYDPQREFKDMRRAFGIGPSEIIIGMVARFQRYRRTEFFLEAVKAISGEFPNIKVLLVGRSSQMEESVIKPMKRLGVEPWVVLGGYRTEDYLDTLACMDIFVFLMAGSDGTARALREAMAMGKPVIVADRGMLPELVEDGVSGLVVEDTPEGLARAALRLLRDPELRLAMGRAAYEKAHRDFRLDRQVEAVERFYQEMIGLGRWKRR